MKPQQTVVTVTQVAAAGAYRLLTVRAPALSGGFLPGQFAAVAVGGEQTSMLLRRCFSIYRADADSMQILVAEHGKGTRWLVQRQPGDMLDVVAPLGRPFPMPDPGAECTLVGGGYGSVPLFALADRLRERGHRVHMVLGAATEDRLFGVDEARAVADSVTVTTDDGSAGQRGLVSDALPGVLAATGDRAIYACGPMAMLRAVTQFARAVGAVAYCAVEEAMACGIGVCMTCVLPVIGDDDLTRMVRACVDGPVFNGTRVRWDDVGTVPADCVGAPTRLDAVAGGRS